MKKMHLFGDSTCASKAEDKRPETGWGEKLIDFLGPEWVVFNNARNGMSTKSCLDSGTFLSGLERIEKGDVAILQFGHNDSKEDEKRRTEPWSSYQANLKYMKDKIEEKEAMVIFLSSITRRLFKDGHIYNSHGEYPEAVKALAKSLNAPFVDMNKKTMEFFDKLGDEESKKYFMNFPAGLYPLYPEGREDNSHLRTEGASLIAGMVYEEIVEYL
ncbi:MAG: rhamnogalacturonan acetylesterase [Sphaerochaetaceae bacterium]|nr:rhamnogalacturonan acetylesterase [Sphaerochaetaceae bacterium]